MKCTDKKKQSILQSRCRNFGSKRPIPSRISEFPRPLSVIQQEHLVLPNFSPSLCVLDLTMYHICFKTHCFVAYLLKYDSYVITILLWYLCGFWLLEYIYLWCLCYCLSIYLWYLWAAHSVFSYADNYDPNCREFKEIIWLL